MTAKEQFMAEVENISLNPPTDPTELKALFLKMFEFLKDVIPSEKFDKFVDKQIAKLEDDKVDAFDVLFVLIKAVFAKE